MRPIKNNITFFDEIYNINIKQYKKERFKEPLLILNILLLIILLLPAVLLPEHRRFSFLS